MAHIYILRIAVTVTEVETKNSIHNPTAFTKVKERSPGTSQLQTYKTQPFT